MRNLLLLNGELAELTSMGRGRPGAASRIAAAARRAGGGLPDPLSQPREPSRRAALACARMPTHQVTLSPIRRAEERAKFPPAPAAPSGTSYSSAGESPHKLLVTSLP